MKKTVLLLTIYSITSSMHAYENSFFNNTNEPIGIAIQYTGNDGKEPLYKKLVKPGSMITLTPDEGDIPAIKWGFCLDKIYYIKNPTSEQKAHNFAKTTWKEISITWITEKSTTKKVQKKQAKKPITQELANPVAKSLCRSRHFDIIQDPHGKIAITSSLSE